MPHRESPQEALAAAIGGEILTPNVITVGHELRVVTYPSGGVYILRRPYEERGPKLGTWSDGADALAEEFHEAVREVCS